MSRIIISLPEKLLNVLDAYTEENGYNRSECIRFAIRKFIQENTYVAFQKKPESLPVSN